MGRLVLCFAVKCFFPTAPRELLGRRFFIPMKTNLTKLAHDTAREFLAGVSPLYAIDATVGNGFDTLFLCSLAAESGGRVFGFDVNAEAVERTRARLAENSLSDFAEISVCGHERIAESVPAEYRGKIACSFFNLGWLPRSDKSTITKSETTLAALAAAVEFADKSRGLLSVLCYRGHDGGAAECAAVEEFFDSLGGCKIGKYFDSENPVSPKLIIAEFPAQNKSQKSV